MRSLFLLFFLPALYSSCSDHQIELENTEYFGNEHFIQFEEYELQAQYVDLLSDETIVVGGTGDVSGSFAFDPFLLQIGKSGELKSIQFAGLSHSPQFRNIDMTRSRDEKYVMASTVWTDRDNSDLLVMKVGLDGEKVWEMSEGEPQKYEKGLSLDRVDDYSFIVLSSQDEERWNSIDKYLISKFSNDGNLLWHRSFTDYSIHLLYKLVSSKNDSSFYLIYHKKTRFSILGAPSIIKYNELAEPVDSVILSESRGARSFTVDMEELEDGSFLVHYSAYEKGEQGNLDLIIKWLDPDLNELRSFVDSEVPGNLVKDALPLPEGGILVLSQSADVGNGEFDIILTEYDDVGRVLWRSVFGGPASDHALALKRKANGDIWIVGNTNQGQPSSNSYELILIRVDAQGVPLG